LPRANRTCGHRTGKENCPFKATHGNRCEEHAREYEEKRGGKVSRGYDKEYDAARRRAAVVVAGGQAVCWRCQEKISPGEEWHLGHRDDGSIGGPEHARTCNLRAAGLKAAGKNWSPRRRR